MRKKTNSEAGLTVVEMLAAVAVLTLLVMMLGTGLQMVMSTYQSIIARSEVDLLVSTAVDALADELRYARDVSGTGEEVNGTTICSDFTYTSDSFEGTIRLGLNDGRIVAKENSVSGDKGKQVLSTGAYGSGGNKSYKEYQVTKMTIVYKDGTFEIYLEVEADGWNGAKISANTSVTVRCLNPAKVTTS